MQRSTTSLRPERERRKAQVTLTIRVPKKRKGSRRSHYISASTQGMSFTFAGSTSTVKSAIGLTRSDPRCHGSPLTCTIVEDVPAGKYKVTIDAYNAAPVRGAIPSTAKLLSTAANVAFTASAGKRNTLGVTLDGVVSALSMSGIPNGVAGTGFNVVFGVTAKDAGGNVIVGAYANPVTLSDNDKTGAIQLATTGFDYPAANELISSIDTPTLTYNGLATNTGVTIAATASGATAAHATFTSALSPIGPAALVGGVPVNPYGASTTVSFTASEPGWTNAPFDKALTAVLSNDCSTVATVSPSSGTVFTATLVSGATTSGSCTLTLSDSFGQQLVIPIGYQLFGYTGSAQSFVVPTAITQVTVTASGAAGAGGTNAGNGGTVIATIPATAGDSLGVYVGGTTSTCAGGYNGGATCGGNGCNSGGGGASDVREGGSTITPTDYRIVVAGGGGGGGCASGGLGFGPVAAGGAGGGQGGGNGANLCGFGCAYGGYSDGTGYEVGGNGGSGYSCGYAPCNTGSGGTTGGNGTLGQGGAGGSGGSAGTNGASGEGGAGGGGGFYGGGGGGGGQGTAGCYSSCSNGGGGGGGGGAYAEATAISVVYGTSATQTGNGQILIGY